MGKAEDCRLQKMENHLLAQEDDMAVSAHIYNSDRTDVDMEHYTEQVCEMPRKRSCLGILIVLLLVAICVFLYLAWGGQMPWK